MVGWNSIRYGRYIRRPDWRADAPRRRRRSLDPGEIAPERIKELDPVKDRTVGEVLTEYDWDLVEAGDSPYLSIEIAQPVGGHAAKSLKDDGPGQRIYLKRSAKSLDLG